MILRSILIDDERNNLDNLRNLLAENCPEVEVVASAINAAEGKQMISQYQPDLVFLDINMPEQSGFDLLRSLPRHDFEIIFVTAHDNFGIQAIKFSAIDYLVKPVNIDELKHAVGRVMDKKQRSLDNPQLNNLLQLLRNQNFREDHKIALTTLKETRFVNTNDILRCESSNNYTTFFLKNGEKILVSKPIYEYEEILNDYGFIRCHQSHLVNRNYIKSWVKAEGDYLLLETGDEIPISRSKKERVAQRLKADRS